MGQEFEKKLLDTIKEKDITPKPRWEFLVKDSFFWSLAVFTVVLGALCVSTIAAILHSGDWDIAERLGHSSFGYMVAILPHAWLIILFGFIFLADYYIRHTKKGYTYSLLAIVSIVVLASVVLGLLLFRVGIGHEVDEYMIMHVPQYESYGNRRGLELFHPEKGVLAGKVSLIEEERWYVIDREYHEWHVNVEEAKIWERQPIRQGMMVRIVGKLNHDEFDAEYVKPLHPPRGMRLYRPAPAY